MTLGLQAVDYIHSINGTQWKNDDVEGILGLDPAYGQDHIEKQMNFIDQLKSSGHIQHKIFSIFTDMAEGNTTHMKFGNYDQVGIKNGNYLTMLQTKNLTTWAI